MISIGLFGQLNICYKYNNQVNTLRYTQQDIYSKCLPSSYEAKYVTIAKFYSTRFLLFNNLTFYFLKGTYLLKSKNPEK